MKIPRAAIIAVMVTVLATLGSLVQRQFAQSEPVSQAQLVLDDQTQRVDLDGLEFERKLVKGAPFSATLTVEATQSGSDGSIRTRTATSLIFRDTEGRTRRDRMPLQLSSAAPVKNEQPQTSIINDPIAGFSYALEHGPRVYHRAAFRSWSEPGSDEAKTPPVSITKGGRNSQMLPLPMNGDRGAALKKVTTVVSSNEIKSEQLGDREIEGVKAAGTRISTAIPAGSIGNEQPMEIIVERWYSPELQTPVLIKRSDPRFGEIVYRLRDIKPADQPASLFVIPNGYKISLDK